MFRRQIWWPYIREAGFYISNINWVIYLGDVYSVGGYTQIGVLVAFYGMYLSPLKNCANKAWLFVSEEVKTVGTLVMMQNAGDYLYQNILPKSNFLNGLVVFM